MVSVSNRMLRLQDDAKRSLHIWPLRQKDTVYYSLARKFVRSRHIFTIPPCLTTEVVISRKNFFVHLKCADELGLPYFAVLTQWVNSPVKSPSCGIEREKLVKDLFKNSVLYIYNYSWWLWVNNTKKKKKENLNAILGQISLEWEHLTLINVRIMCFTEGFLQLFHLILSEDCPTRHVHTTTSHLALTLNSTIIVLDIPNVFTFKGK